MMRRKVNAFNRYRYPAKLGDETGSPGHALTPYGVLALMTKVVAGSNLQTSSN